MSNTVVNQARLEYLFNKYYEILCQFSYSIVKDNDVSRDIVQDFFIKYWEKYQHQDQPDNFEAYAYVSVKNRSINYLESEQVKQRHKQGIEQSLYSDDHQPHSDNEAYRSRLLTAISQLPEQRRRVFTMSAVEGLKYTDIAQKLDISINTVKTQIRKAYIFLRKNCGPVSILLLINAIWGSPFFYFQLS